jgi:hypothetical protein
VNRQQRDRLGKLVRRAWIEWAKTQPNPKPSWLVPYEQLSDADKEADRHIAETLLHQFNTRRLALIDKKYSPLGTTPEESIELGVLQKCYFDTLSAVLPDSNLPDSAQLDQIEQRLDGEV